MITAEKVREWIVKAIWKNPILGKHFINWHTEDGECGLTLMFANAEFEIIIRQK